MDDQSVSAWVTKKNIEKRRIRTAENLEKLKKLLRSQNDYRPSQKRQTP